MVLPHSGFLNETTELLRIETDQFNLFIQGKPFHPTVEALKLHRDDNEWVASCIEVNPSVVPINISSIRIFSPKKGSLIEIGEDRTFPIFYENQDYQFVIQQKSTRKVSFFHDSELIRRAVKPLAKTNILTGVINFRNEIGYTEFEILVDGLSALSIRLEIFPSKIDYKKDYQLILQDINEQIYNLSFDFLRKTYQLTGLRETQNQSLTEFFTILQHLFRHLVATIDRIKIAPNNKLKRESRILDSAKVKKVEKNSITYLSKKPYLLAENQEVGIININGNRYIPKRLIEAKKHLDFDTNENRFIRWVLERTYNKLREVKNKIKKMNRVNDLELILRIDRMMTQIYRLLNIDFIKNSGPMRQLSMSLVLQMAPGYRDVYRYYLILMKGLSIQGDLFRLSMKDLAQLYEYWCFLKIHSILRKKYELIKQDIIRLNRNGLFVTLDKSRSARVHYRNPKNGETFILYYNSLPQDDINSPTLSQRPDNVFALRKVDSNVEYKYVFDAKYRLNPAYEGSSYYNSYKIPGPEEDDINTMHRYRDAIVHLDNSSGDYERSMFGAFVLFPYTDEEKFREHHFYKSIKKVNVGALPFLPNATKLIEEFLDELIIDSPEKAFERAIVPRGTKEYYYDKLSWKNVLIGSLRFREQLELCLSHGFYYIPLKWLIQEQKIITSLEYIGIYQSNKLFKDAEKGIHWIGDITKFEVLPRIEITEVPISRNNARELYVKFYIGEWKRLEYPIKPGGHGVYSHLFTSRYILDRARYIAELRLDTEEQILEWREKRRIGKINIFLDHENVDQANKVLKISIKDDF